MKTIFNKTLLAASIAAVAANATATTTVDADPTATTVKEIWQIPVEGNRTTLAIESNAIGFYSAVANGHSIGFNPAATSDSDLVVTLNNALFKPLGANLEYALCVQDGTNATATAVAQNTGGVATTVAAANFGVLNANQITFSSVSLATGTNYSLCVVNDSTANLSAAAGFQFQLTAAQQAANQAVTMNFKFGNGTINDETATIANYANYWAGTTPADFDATIDAVNNDALNFGGTTTKVLTDTGAATLGVASPAGYVLGFAAPTFGTVVGSLTFGVEGLSQSAVTGVVLDLATDEAFTKNSEGVWTLTSTNGVVGTNTIKATIDGTTQVDPTTMDISLSSTPAATYSNSVTYLTTSATSDNAGAWALNGTQAKIAYMPINYSTINPIIKLSNEGTTTAKIIISAAGRNMTDETDVDIDSKTSTVTIAGGSLSTLTNADIISALGLDSTKQYQLELTLLVTGDQANINIAAQYKDESNGGRVAVPVLYRTADATRTFQ